MCTESTTRKPKSKKRHSEYAGKKEMKLTQEHCKPKIKNSWSKKAVQKGVKS
jgi:hypothetical protein